VISASSCVILAWRLRLYSRDSAFFRSLALSQALDMAFMRAASSDASDSCSARSRQPFMYSGSSASRICAGSCSKMSAESSSGVAIGAFSRSTTNSPPRVVSLKISSSAASTHLPLTSQTAPDGASGSIVCTIGSDEISDTNLV